MYIYSGPYKLETLYLAVFCMLYSCSGLTGSSTLAKEVWHAVVEQTPRIR